MMTNDTTYSLLDSGNGFKLERFGPYLLKRPCATAMWQPQTPTSQWKTADASFVRDPNNTWTGRDNLPNAWTIEVGKLQFQLKATDFGHLGIFPEQKSSWEWIQNSLAKASLTRNTPLKVLNLFAYSGGSTLAAAKAGAEVCHLDASKGMVSWARENAELNGLKEAPIRWIIDDAFKFLKREKRRGKTYDAIILDPPSFGRGSNGEAFKIEENLQELLNACRDLLSDSPLFVLFSCHTPGFTPTVMEHLTKQMMQGHLGRIDTGEMQIDSELDVYPVPSGVFARWTSE
jgi:23S rRNA (cytosine1962-C5)-methyltransferase